MSNLKGNISSTQNLSGGSAINVAVTPNITIGKVTTLEPNASVIVELDESSTRMNPVFNFGIPTGKTGEKGDAGSVKFIIANELPTENIEESAIYMIPSGATTEGNTYEEYIYVNGVWESLGSASVNVDLADYLKKANNPVTNFNAIYGIDMSNEQKLFKCAVGQGGEKIPMTDGYGCLKVAEPRQSNDTATKNYVDTGFIKHPTDTTYGNFILMYVVDTNGGVGKVTNNVKVTGSAVQGSIAQRGVNGALSVGEPTADVHATTKNYVDNLVGDIESLLGGI